MELNFYIRGISSNKMELQSQYERLQSQYEQLADELIATRSKDVIEYRNGVQTVITDRKTNQMVHLPILTIDGVRTICYLELDNELNATVGTHRWNTVVYFKANNPFQPRESYLSFISSFSPPMSDTPVIDKQIVTEQIKDIFLKIGSLTYDMGSRFVTALLNRHEYIYDICTLPNVTLTADKCCVCLNMTESKTKCNHHLCLRCWTRLPDVEASEDEDSDGSIPEIGHSCPMCRRFMPED